MITLGIDSSLTGFGWCLHNSSVAGEGRVIAKGVISTTAETLIYQRYIYLRDELLKLLQQFPEIENSGLESSIFGESQSEGMYGLFLYVNEALYLSKKDVVYFDPLRVKLLAKMDPEVRKGPMDKSDMIDIAKQDTGIKRWNNNEADAYIVARSAARFWELYSGMLSESELTPAEKHVFLKTHTITKGRRKGREIRSGILYKENDRFYRFSTI